MIFKILEPINILLSYVVKIFCFIFSIDLKKRVSAADEVRGVIEHHMHKGNVVKDDRDMLGGILDLRDMIIADIMVHRSNMVAINIDTKSEKIINMVLSSSHTRVPFWDDNHDNIIGILHIKDLLGKVYNKKDYSSDIDVGALLSDPAFIPDNALVTQQLQTFRVS